MSLVKIVSDASMQTECTDTKAVQTEELFCREYDRQSEESPPNTDHTLPSSSNLQQLRYKVSRDPVWKLPRKKHAYTGDEMCVDETLSDQNYFVHLENQRRMKEDQLQQLLTKRNFGFKPTTTRKPF